MRPSQSSRTGVVYLVGAGPGDPGLLTRRGAQVLATADVVVYDHLVHPRLLDLAPARAERIFAGKRQGQCALPQESINQLLAEHAQRGQTVVRLKGGDPFVFGRGAEEAEYLAAQGVPFQVVPGVTAGVGVTSYAGVPITHRDTASAVAFVTGHGDPNAEPHRVDWSALARFPGTVVVYMGVTHLRSLCQRLISEGRAGETPAALVQWGTLARQRTIAAPLAELPDRVAEAGLGPPALLVVGEVVARRAPLAWFERLPLFGQRILVTRPDGDRDGALAKLEVLGAEVLEAAPVKIEPVADPGPMDRAIDRLHDFDWVAFTSANGVRHFLERLEARGLDLRALGRVKLAAIGPATARALADFHLHADLVPEAYRSEELAAALADRVAGQRVLLARADRGRTLLRTELESIAHVEQVAVYHQADVDSLPAPVMERLAEGSIDWLTLTSTSIAESLHTLLPVSIRGRIGQSLRLASISPVTSAAAARLGWTVAVEAQTYTWDGLVEALVADVRKSRAGEQAL